MSNDLKERVQAVSRTPGTLSPATATKTESNTTGAESRIVQHRADTVHRLKQGRRHPFRVALPTYEALGPTDTTAGNTETFNLGREVISTPNTEDVVVWLDGSYYGQPDAVDYANNTIDVTDAGTGSTVHVYYITDDPATLTVRKETPGGDTKEPIYSANLKLVHQTRQSEDPEYLTLTDSEWQEFVASDMTLEIYVDAPYPVQFTDDNGDGTEPTNALLHLPVEVGQDTVAGLQGRIKQDMGARSR